VRRFLLRRVASLSDLRASQFSGIWNTREISKELQRELKCVASASGFQQGRYGVPSV